jgi:hypothetical protein
MDVLGYGRLLRLSRLPAFDTYRFGGFTVLCRVGIALQYLRPDLLIPTTGRKDVGELEYGNQVRWTRVSALSESVAVSSWPVTVSGS